MQILYFHKYFSVFTLFIFTLLLLLPAVIVVTTSYESINYTLILQVIVHSDLIRKDAI